jgi:hypothetical protein
LKARKAKRKSNIMIPTSHLEDAAGEKLARISKYSKEEYLAREKSILSHVHAIAERYREELSHLSLHVSQSKKG